MITSGGERVRLAGIGVIDVLESDTRGICVDNLANITNLSHLGKNVAEGQRDDILALGHVILTLATRSIKDSVLSRQHLANNVLLSRQLCNVILVQGSNYFHRFLSG